jgi:hypothetical protein
MTELERRAALFARVDTLERHATTLREAFTDPAFTRDAQKVLDLLHSARMSLEVAKGPDQLVSVEHAIDAASLLLASLGKST